jgi:hypothetical protein
MWRGSNEFVERKRARIRPIFVYVRTVEAKPRQQRRSASIAKRRGPHPRSTAPACPAPAGALSRPAGARPRTASARSGTARARPRPAAARPLPGRAPTGSPLARGRRLARRRRAGRFAAPRGGAAALPSALLCRSLVGLAAAARTRFAPTTRHRVLRRPSATLRLFTRYATALIALFDMPSLTPLFGGVGRLVTTRHDPLQVELRREDQPAQQGGAVRPVTRSCGQAERVWRAEKKVGGTGTSARSREMNKKGELMGKNSESSGSNSAPGH